MAVSTSNKLHRNAKDLRGRRFGNLVVFDLAAKRANTTNLFWECLCDCGRTKSVASNHLTSGHTKGCGICTHSRLRHGECNTRAYGVWNGILQRCGNPKNLHYAYYGGRGITICKHWLVYENFVKDMGQPLPGFTIERINHDGNYEPDNCRWATRAEQMRNTRQSHWVIYKGTKLCLRDWATKLGITPPALRRRLKHWPIARALSAPRCN